MRVESGEQSEKSEEQEGRNATEPRSRAERTLLARQIINNQAGVCAVLARFANEPAFSRCRLEAYNYMLASLLVCTPRYSRLSIGCSNYVNRSLVRPEANNRSQSIRVSHGAASKVRAYSRPVDRGERTFIAGRRANVTAMEYFVWTFRWINSKLFVFFAPRRSGFLLGLPMKALPMLWVPGNDLIEDCLRDEMDFLSG